MNVNYFGVDWDLDVQIATSRLSRRVLSSPFLEFVTHSPSSLPFTYADVSLPDIGISWDQTERRSRDFWLFPMTEMAGPTQIGPHGSIDRACSRASAPSTTR